MGQLALAASRQKAMAIFWLADRTFSLSIRSLQVGPGLAACTTWKTSLIKSELGGKTQWHKRKRRKPPIRNNTREDAFSGAKSRSANWAFGVGWGWLGMADLGVATLHRASLQSAGPVLQTRSCYPCSRAARDCSPAGWGLAPRSVEEVQEECCEGTALLSLWQPTSDGEFLPPESSFAKEQLGVACKALLIARFPTEWQTCAQLQGCSRQVGALRPCSKQRASPVQNKPTDGV